MGLGVETDEQLLFDLSLLPFRVIYEQNRVNFYFWCKSYYCFIVVVQKKYVILVFLLMEKNGKKKFRLENWDNEKEIKAEKF